MRAIKIDIEKQSIYEIDIQPGLAAMYEHLDCQMIKCPCFIDPKNILYVDEEGLLKPRDQIKGGFNIKAFPSQSLIGHGLITGTDQEGNDTECTLTIEEVTDMVTFLTTEEALSVYDAFNAQVPKIWRWQEPL